jgi:hypothetical protein
MSAEPGLLAKVFDWIKLRLARDDELGALSAADLNFLASDIGVSVADLHSIGPALKDHAGLLEDMLRARGLDPDMVRFTLSGVMRDMEITCARCREAGVCQRELAADTAAAHAHEFCPNAGIIDELLAAR